MLLGVIVGLVAEWLRRGLQILAPRFDSGRGLQQNMPLPLRDGLNGRASRQTSNVRARAGAPSIAVSG